MTQIKIPKYDSKEEDQAIIQIKTIASEIFTSDFEQFASLNLNIGFMHLQKYGKAYSQTERQIAIDRQDCMSQWIAYDEFSQHGENIPKNSKTIGNTYKNIQKNNKTQKKQKFNKQKVSDKPQFAMKKSNKTKGSINNTQDQKVHIGKEVKKKIKIEDLRQCGFMKLTGQLREQTALYKAYKLKQQEQEQLKIQNKEKMKTLEELYKQKQPLYEKFLKQKQKKIKLICQSRISNEQKQIYFIKQKPDINSNIKINGSFDQRQKQNIKKVEENKAKIMNDMLKSSPFQPQINNTKKYKQVESVIKKLLSSKDISSSHFDYLIQSNIQENQKILTYNDTFMQKNSVKNWKKVHDLRLNSSTELGHILQMQGKQEQ